MVPRNAASLILQSGLVVPLVPYWCTKLRYTVKRERLLLRAREGALTLQIQ